MVHTEPNGQSIDIQRCSRSDGCVEPSYTIFILTEAFQSELKQPRIFIDLIDEETNATGYMRLMAEYHDGRTILDNLYGSVLGAFRAYGQHIDQVQLHFASTRVMRTTVFR